uniref:Cytochrome P450 4c3 n=1 Tax=Lygus hesperus TaxID=30085 RepID=A0A0A9ZHK3_LYGHE
MTASSLKRKLFQFLTRRRDPQVRRIVEITKSIINKRRAVLSSLESNIDHGEPSCYTDVIIQIAREEGADEEEMCKPAVDFLVAGSETTSTTISCAILFLAMHPEYQEKVQDELRQIFKDSRKTPASTDDLHKMKYLEMVIYETLRHCGIPLVARRLATDTNLDGYHLPSKSLLMFRFMNVCRNLQWWDRPSAFSPDNFLPEAEAARPKGSFTPFSLGTRSCPGNIFALTSMKVILSTALREFTFTTNLKFEEITYQYGLMQTPESLVVTAHPRVVDYTKEESL